MSETPDYILLHEDELLGALEEVEPDCAGGRGVHIDLATGEAYGVVIHAARCVHGRPALRLVPPAERSGNTAQPLTEERGADEAERARRARIAWTEPGGGVA